ncbi:MAG: O-acetylhomoserine aminocarboxypropyltransferase/cysteine synthase [Ruminobacter sp.]|jgi:O-acetylhomoserine (thiol)-lyase|nr:O-acetylhomoserine aminocarboxypropyltransferase/cysteine synthase [Ruminobacter sp.]MBR1924063.1 O-acetylhomoserine aminocarboxypropyltransferase/cysteine synthase [Ruminobacter sp.]
MTRNCGFNTLLLHGKGTGGFAEREILPPVSQGTAFQYESMEDLESVFAHRKTGFAYTRIGNPTIAAFEQKINALEGGFGAICTGSGMAAVSGALLTVCQSGDEIIAGSGMYGGTIRLLRNFERLGIRTVFTPKLNAENVSALINERTRVVFGELIGNPSLNVLDVPAVSAVAHEHGVPLFVDSTTATPYIARPLELGADVVIHSTSKYINGTGSAIGGMIIDGGRFNWKAEKHGALADFVQYGRMAFSVRARTEICSNLGGCISPFNAFISHVGVDTLGLRMERICENAAALAERLDKEKDISVNYLTLKHHPDHEYVTGELNGYGGGILTIRAGSKERAFEIINSLKYVKIASNLGDVRTLVIHPASTLYRHNSRHEAEAAGVYEDTIRISVGIENKEDLIEDFLEAIAKSRHEQ